MYLVKSVPEFGSILPQWGREASRFKRSCMSAMRHIAIRPPILTGAGYRPSAIPAYQLDLLIGKHPYGPMMDLSLKNPHLVKSQLPASAPFRTILFDIGDPSASEITLMPSGVLLRHFASNRNGTL